MTPYQSYHLLQAGWPKSPAEQRAADARNGELAAAIARSFRGTSARIRAVVRRQAGGSRQPAGRTPQRTHELVG